VLSGIYGVVDLGLTQRPLELLDALLAGGVRVVQYRAKTGVERSVVRAMHERTRASSGILIVNDDFEASLEADGWHAGQEDLAGLDLIDVRRRLGPRLFGVSCGVAEEALAAERNGADYVGVGPYAATSTKLDAGAAIGSAGVRAVARATQLPVVAIGGIDASNLVDVARSGARMAAVVSAFTRANDAQALAAELVSRWASAFA
jgi:thiamine-phosphate pyrophosphorylase